MQIKFLSLGLLAVAVVSVAADTVKVTGTDIYARNTVSGNLDGLHANVASKRSTPSSRKVADAIRRHSRIRYPHHSENEADEEEDDEDEDEDDEDEADERIINKKTTNKRSSTLDAVDTFIL